MSDSNGNGTREDKTLNDDEIFINKIFGIIYLIVSSLAIFLQGIIFYTYKRHPTLFENTAYKIMLHLGCCGLIQQLSYFITSFTLIFYYYKPYWIDLTFGAISQGMYLLSISFIVLLTMNCFDVFYQQIFFPSINRSTFFNWGIVLCYLWGLVSSCIYMVPEFSLKYSHEEVGYIFRGKYESYKYAWELENKVVIVFLSLSFFIYILIIIKIQKLRYQNNGNSRSVFCWRDIKFLIQAILNFFLYVTVELLWEFGDDILPDNRYSSISINYIFFFTTMNNTILCILLIPEVRRSIKELFFCYKQHKISVMTSKLSRAI